MVMKQLILVSGVVAVISLLMSPQVANHLASTQAAAMAVPYISHAVAWRSGLSLPNVLTFVGAQVEPQAILNKIMGETSIGEMTKAMRNFFEGVEIRKEDVHEMEKKLKRDLVESWDIKVFQESSIGIPEIKFLEFGDDMIRQLRMKKEASEDLKKKIMQLLYLDSKERNVWDFVIEEETLSSHYGYVSF